MPTTTTPPAVTHKPKRYVFTCAVCGLLAESSRSDALTCSTACRVKGHRSGDIARLLKICEGDREEAARVMQVMALEVLCPDRLPSFLTSGFTAEMRNAVAGAFRQRCYEAAKAYRDALASMEAGA